MSFPRTAILVGVFSLVMVSPIGDYVAFAMAPLLALGIILLSEPLGLLAAITLAVGGILWLYARLGQRGLEIVVLLFVALAAASTAWCRLADQLFTANPAGQCPKWMWRGVSINGQEQTLTLARLHRPAKPTFEFAAAAQGGDMGSARDTNHQAEP